MFFDSPRETCDHLQFLAENVNLHEKFFLKKIFLISQKLSTLLPIIS